MNNKQSTENKIIRYGEIHAYYPFKISAELSYEETCQLILKSSLIYNKKYQEQILSELEISATIIADNLNKIPENPYNFRVPIIYNENANFQNNNNTFTENIFAEISFTDSSLGITLENIKLSTLETRLKNMDVEYKESSKIYGERFTNSHNRFILLPLKIQLPNRESVWLIPILYIFSNKSGILKFELPLFNVESTPLKANCIDNYISNAECSWDKNLVVDTSMKKICSFYFQQLFQNNDIFYFYFGDSINNVILVDYDGLPADINKIESTTQEELFRIVCAPVPTHTYTSYKKDAHEYLNNHTWGTHNIRYIIKTTGGCLSTIDSKLLNSYFSYNNSNLNSFNNNKTEYKELCNILAYQINLNAEYSLIIILLEKLNSAYDYAQKKLMLNKINNKELTNIQNEYWENIIYINGLQENCYGSACEQLSIFKSHMSHYIKKEQTVSKLMAMDNIIKNNEITKREKLQQTISVASMIIAILFGLPSIYETLAIIRTFCNFITFDVPIISQSNLSILLWLILIFCIIKYFKRNK